MGNKKEDIKLEGLVIRKVACKENDAMITVLGKDGIFSFYARGVNKISSKNIASCSLLSYSSFVLTSQVGDKLVLKESSFKKSYLNDSSYSSLSVANFLLELVSKGLDEDRKEDAIEIYPYLLLTLEELNRSKFPLSLALSFFIKFLESLGIGLNLNNCVRCGKKEGIVGLSYDDGGFICKDCLTLNDHKLNVETLKFIHYVSISNMDNISKIPPLEIGVYPVLEGLKKFLFDETGIEIKSLKLLKAI